MERLQAILDWLRNTPGVADQLAASHQRFQEVAGKQGLRAAMRDPVHDQLGQQAAGSFDFTGGLGLGGMAGVIKKVGAPQALRTAAKGTNYDLIDSLSQPGHFYRGMTQGEFDATVGAGKGVQSRRDFSHSSEGTSFGDDFATSESYANYGRDDPRKTGKPTYVVEIKGDEGLVRDPRDGYVKASNEIPAERINRVFMSSPDGEDLTLQEVLLHSLGLGR